jgi:hypothetical protein
MQWREIEREIIEDVWQNINRIQTGVVTAVTDIEQRVHTVGYPTDVEGIIAVDVREVHRIQTQGV